jgi:DNA-binding response OmpR family regulator
MKNILLIDGEWKQPAFIAANPEDAATAQALYDQHKIEGADLIAVDIMLPSGSGIINCRVNGDHKQIRF